MQTCKCANKEKELKHTKKGTKEHHARRMARSQGIVRIFESHDGHRRALQPLFFFHTKHNERDERATTATYDPPLYEYGWYFDLVEFVALGENNLSN
jgi:hypothetical protein